MTSTESTGMIATSEVLIDRASVWFIERLTIVRVGHPARRAEALRVVRDPVEDDHGVVERVPEDGQDGDHRVRGHLEARRASRCPTVTRRSWITATIAAIAILDSKRSEM